MRGREEALTVARAFLGDNVKPDLALVSSAARTTQTFSQVESVLGDIKVRFLDELYNAEVGVIRRVIEAHEDAAECLLVIGHNPGIQYLCVDYMIGSGASMSALDKVKNGFSTATAVIFEVDVAGRPVYDGVHQPGK
jgi:phosphohistidine phosphatase